MKFPSQMSAGESSQNETSKPDQQISQKVHDVLCTILK